MNKITSRWVDAYIAHPKAAVLLEANEDIEGANAVAERLHSALIGGPGNPVLIVSSEEKNTIGVDKIRQLKKHLSLQASKSAKTISRMILIEEADRMTEEAQNGLLKLIEELPEKTIVCLTSARSTGLLSTITSRCFTIKVLPLEETVALGYAQSKEMSLEEAKRMYAISRGSPGVFTSLVDGDNSTISQSIYDAKQFLSFTVFERQKFLAIVLKKPEEIPNFLRAIRVIALTGLRTSKQESKQRWKQTIEETVLTERQLAANVPIKLALLRLSISL